MANEFKVRKGLVVNGSGSVILDIQGSQGQLFSITDQLSGSLFAVSDISGIPVMEAFSDNTVRIGRYGFEAIKVSGSVASVTGSFTGSFTGSLFGTASQALTASFVLGGGGGSGFPFTGSASITGSFRVSGSTNISASSYALQILGSGSSVFSVDGTVGRLFEVDDSLSGSLFSVNTAAGLPIIEAFSDNTVRIGQFGQRALFVSQSRVGIGTEAPVTTLDVSGSVRITNGLSLTGSLSSASPISASAILSTGAITAQTLVVQTITSSVSFVTGSTRFGSLLTNTHEFTGSVRITGSLTVNTTGTEFQVTNNGVVMGNLLTDNHSVTGSLIITGSIIQSGANTTSSFTGNVGIGTTSPAYKLDVSGSGRFIFRNNSSEIMDLLLSTESANSLSKLSLLWYGNETAAVKFGRGGDSTGGVLSFWTQANGGSTTERIRIAGDGNVGIGTSSPLKTLDVFGSNGNTTSQIKVRSTGNTSAGYFGTFFNSLYISVGGTYDSGWSIDGTNGIANIVMETSNGGSAIAFGTANGNTTATERMRITSGGNVGIGTTSPSQVLHVFNASNYVGALINGSNAPQLCFAQGVGTSPNWKVGISGNDGNAFSISSGSINDDKLVILRNGNVGIGTFAPSSKLEVRNDVAASTNLAPTSLKLYNNSDGGSAIDFSNGVSGTSKLSFGVESTGAGTDDTFIAFNTGTNTTATEKMRITSGGYLRLASNGIQFNGDTADANSLDDYEEGTFTPTLTIGGSSAGITYANRNAAYTKVGRLVTIQVAIRMTSIGSNTGDIRITGLPFNVISDAYYHPYGVVGLVLQPAVLPLYALGAGSEINFRKANVTTDTSPTHSDINNDTYIFVTMTYSAT